MVVGGYGLSIDRNSLSGQMTLDMTMPHKPTTEHNQLGIKSTRLDFLQKIADSPWAYQVRLVSGHNNHNEPVSIDIARVIYDVGPEGQVFFGKAKGPQFSSYDLGDELGQSQTIMQKTGILYSRNYADLGVTVEGVFKKFGYSLGVMQGSRLAKLVDDPLATGLPARAPVAQANPNLRLGLGGRLTREILAHDRLQLSLSLAGSWMPFEKPFEVFIKNVNTTNPEQINDGYLAFNNQMNGLLEFQSILASTMRGSFSYFINQALVGYRSAGSQVNHVFSLFDHDARSHGFRVYLGKLFSSGQYQLNSSNGFVYAQSVKGGFLELGASFGYEVHHDTNVLIANQNNLYGTDFGRTELADRVIFETSSTPSNSKNLYYSRKGITLDVNYYLNSAITLKGQYYYQSQKIDKRNGAIVPASPPCYQGLAARAEIRFN